MWLHSRHQRKRGTVVGTDSEGYPPLEPSRAPSPEGHENGEGLEDLLILTRRDRTKPQDATVKLAEAVCKPRKVTLRPKRKPDGDPWGRQPVRLRDVGLHLNHETMRPLHSSSAPMPHGDASVVIEIASPSSWGMDRTKPDGTKPSCHTSNGVTGRRTPCVARRLLTTIVPCSQDWTIPYLCEGNSQESADAPKCP